MLTNQFGEKIRQRIARAEFIMLRYETEFTPCTGITAVTKQERRQFGNGVMIAPWCSCLIRKGANDDPLVNGKVQDTEWSFNVDQAKCSVLATTDEWAPIIFLDVQNRFRGRETPYDTAPESPERDPVATLKRDTLWFGLAVNELLKNLATSKQFVWAADWETVPALFLLRSRHHTALTLHNTFDACLADQSREFGTVYTVFQDERLDHEGKVGPVTALEKGIQISDVVTTVNRGFAHGMRTEPLQQDVMAKHLRHLLGKVVGINNAAFSTLSDQLIRLRKKLSTNFSAGRDELFELKAEQLAELPTEVKTKAASKAIVVSMGRRVSQKQHDVLVESLRDILTADRRFPVLAVFATVHGDSGSPARLERIRALQAEFPANVVCEDGQLAYYKTLMAAADFNCMPSLYEPHGGAYEGTVIPIGRAIDGLAEQICGLVPNGAAARINAEWHTKNEAPTGFLFREESQAGDALAKQLQSLLEVSPSPENEVFKAMRDSLTEVLRQAVAFRLNQKDAYAGLVLAALQKQESSSWQVNLGGMIALIEQARISRHVA